MAKNENNTNINEVKYVIGPGGLRMTYEEWLEMKKAEGR